ncbi:MAG: RpiB/LacA/LacB family sugar-phosphate isomerase [Deltaproteobacteria bacterium]|nr:RpiB/LacA/LacB family sugar-phosphate isomerase [Deltaproteobacteria bacterium]
MKIAIGSDHAGYQYKENIQKSLLEMGHDVRDFGTRSEDPVDFPLIIGPVAEAVAKGHFDRGIVFGGSGNGPAIVANRFKGIRCAVCYSTESALLARRHHDANMISIGARMLSPDEALEIVNVWLQTPFEAGRFLKRIRLIDQRDRILQPDKLNTDESGSLEAANGPKTDRDMYDVLISLRYIIYSEGKNAIEFKVDPSLKGPTVIHVPSPERWDVEIGDWAKDRRDDILQRIQSKCVHMTIELREF